MLVRCYICNKLYLASDIQPETRCFDICPDFMDKHIKGAAEGSKAQKNIEKYSEAKER